jgi:radical SAM protein with 4Fe4S-binding SPASM domain
MIVRRHGRSYNFTGDTGTGMTVRWGRSLDEDPLFAPWPELADISIGNNCSKGCEFCYKGSTEDGTVMSLDRYQFVLASLQSPRWGNVFQVALGGGEPLEHPQFTRIIDATADRGIVANFTTNGMLLDRSLVRSIRWKMGALALSVRSIEDMDEKVTAMLKEENIRTNIHFILNNETIEEANEILKGGFNGRLKGVDNVIFLTYKAAGRAGAEHNLAMDDRLMNFIGSVRGNRCSAGVGFDACFVPLLLRHTSVNPDIVDSCECGFFSVYIDEELNVKPCSFATGDDFTFNLERFGMDQIWNREYEVYRKKISDENKCAAKCARKKFCRGRCRFFPGITLCYEELCRN